MRLIRSKGVGVYFVTQNPLDVPDKVLGQLGNRVQHALRAFTPRDQKAVKAAAETFRPNPKLDTAKAIMELGKGEALVSILEGNGTPSMVDRTLIPPPSARVGPITADERKAIIAKSPFKGRYDQAIDPESAYEILRRRVGGVVEHGGGAGAPAPAGTPGGSGGIMDWLGGILGGLFNSPSSTGSKGRSRRMSSGEVMVKQVARTVGTRSRPRGRARRARQPWRKKMTDAEARHVRGE